MAARLAEFKDAFKLLDKDGDGMISWQEFEGFLRSIGQNPTKQDLEVRAECGSMWHGAHRDAGGHGRV
jgi:Ca2+-binding EF-hand superfamily protein